MIKDYSEILERLGKGLGRAYADSPMVIGVPGVSVAVKVDPHYYLAVMPGFLARLAEWAGMFPDTAREALVKTGNLILDTQGEHHLPLTVIWGEPSVSRRIRAAFLPSEFVDRALKLYAGAPAPLPVADLRIHEDDREAVDCFLHDITHIDKTAFTRPV
ncbi:hypothetical protein [Desulfocurvus sp. DL9XJH121]